MLRRLFSTDSPYKKHAKYSAIVWTMLILIGCFAPSKSFPEVDVPLIDKWVHFLMFGGFAFLWLVANPSVLWQHGLRMFLVCVAFGALIEILQGVFSFLGRSMELMDAVADAIGGLLGIILFYIPFRVINKQAMRNPI